MRKLTSARDSLRLESGMVSFLDIMFSALGIFVVIFALRFTILELYRPVLSDLILVIRDNAGRVDWFSKGDQGSARLRLAGNGKYLDYYTAQNAEVLARTLPFKQEEERLRPLRIRIFVPGTALDTEWYLKRALREIASMDRRKRYPLVELDWWPLAGSEDVGDVVAAWRKQLP